MPSIEPYAEPDPDEPTFPTKRLRWATQRIAPKGGSKRRTSIINRLHHRPSQSSEKKRDSGGASSTGTDLDRIQEEQNESPEEHAEDDDKDGQGPRKVFFNIPLPPDAVDDQGLPLRQYRRNKIRTAKYTPLSFIPKNIWFQFHNIANVYFLFLIILTIFSIFGASNPGLNAVPLIVIVAITAIKDAIEDYRRTILDNELNNSPVHRLVDWNNVNVSTDNISLWRRIKKATTRGIVRSIKKVKKDKKMPGETYAERAVGVIDEPRPSFESRAARDDIRMTPVSSPLPADGKQLEIPDRPKTAYSYEAGDDGPAEKNFGSLINRNITPTGKPRFHQDYWKNVQVGDFVRIYSDDQIPADIVILSTSDPDGACYVETKNLDGETNLKVRHALRSGRSIKHARDCERTEFTIDSEPPHPNLYQYSAVARWTQHDSKDGQAEEMVEPISINNLLLRGCNLRNTDWILGVVVFTGFDTKIMLNSGITPSKRSRIARELNWNVVYNFILLFIICFASGLTEGIIWGEGNNTIDYFEFGSIGGKPALNGFITFWAALILFQNLVPISLYISLEIIKTCQAFFIYSDTEMYYDKIDYPCTPKSWNISDDLGQIEYIFSDKTGTLTQNVMEFKKASINGVPYGEAYTEAQAGMQKRQGIDVEKEAARAKEQIAAARAKMLVDIRKLHDNPYLHDDELTFVAPDFVSDLAGESGKEQQDANHQFMLALALCHSVISETTPGDPPKIEFRAQSPDEAALVATARDVGFTVLGNSADGIRLNIQGHDQEYRVLNTLEFNSTRKRMSAIIRMPDNKIILFCKGADSIIYSRLKRGEQPELRRTTAEHLEMFAREGLRTLCIAQRELAEDEYQEWNREHELAAAAIQDREDKLEAVSDAIERDLTLLGGTAIEDRLQEGVPDTIALLAEAGIKLWVLTGDKVETAINIGFSCNLLTNDMELIVFKIEDEQVATAEAELDKHLASFNMTGSDAELKAAKKNHEPPAPTHAIVIDGDSLKLVLDDQLRQKFLLLFLQRLVLVHGRWSYRRLGETIANFFYKNVVWTFTIFWYQIFANFDMTYLFDYTYILLFNLAFTSVPVIFMGVLDQDVSDKVSLAVPQLYRRGIERKEWTQRKFWLYMLDGLYQSIIIFFMAWCLFRNGTFVTESGQNIDDRERFGVYIAPAAVFAINTYILLNTYRWDWLMVLLVAISILLVWFWTGVYSSFTSSDYFYKAAAEVFGQASFWAITALSVMLALLPRFCIKVAQKIYFPYDVDIIREQVRQGKFDYLDRPDEPLDSMSKGSSASSSEITKPSKHTHYPSIDEDQRPIYPPSVAPTSTTTHNPRSQNGSDGTDFTRHRSSFDQLGPRVSVEPPRPSFDQLGPRVSVDRPRPSFDRLRTSMDRVRPSFEASNDFTSAALLTRLESSQSFGPLRSRRNETPPPSHAL
ncbi:phospholipid-translocating P-type ATPase domain-containing protein [Rutstroemia sp. NJR-2017a WRK4]|nr:phospholipid-translocating P-type ATPase domain-containing protein [Rutstroemia sp. NJR-2017a WRK4]